MELLQQLLDWFHQLTDPDRLAALLNSMGAWFYLLLFVVVFCETGLVVTPILPGDSMLFAVGAVASLAGANIDLTIVLLALIAAAVGGDAANYAIGYHVGPNVFTSEHSWLFHRKHLLRTQAFYEKYGAKTIILARFVPIVRTFAAFVAGVGQMPYLRFLPYSICGGIGWVFLMTMLGYELGGIPFIRRYFDKVILLIIFTSLIPTILEIIKARTAKREVLTASKR